MIGKVPLKILLPPKNTGGPLHPLKLLKFPLSHIPQVQAPWPGNQSWSMQVNCFLDYFFELQALFFLLPDFILLSSWRAFWLWFCWWWWTDLIFSFRRWWWTIRWFQGPEKLDPRLSDGWWTLAWCRRRWGSQCLLLNTGVQDMCK